MPAPFDACVRNGGRVRRVSGPNKKLHLEAGEYCNVCFKGGKSFRGHTKKVKSHLAEAVRKG